MAVFKCKMCGGTIEFNQGDKVGVCDSCGTKQTLPNLDDDKRANLYDRANHFRRNNEYDKALGIYEQILNEDNKDAEAYWSIVLCKYGIEYVEDPSSHKRVPTVNRAQFTSIYMDEDYKSAISYADPSQKEIYEAEAKAIDEIQKGILEISSKEEPFDVFICYKETDANGRRTQDSVLANDLYHQLTQEGFKVFFSRITLEDKLGVAYEPYIFAALNSAKVMVALGTKPEYFNAIWVKNEWSRYLGLIKNGAKKMLIPAYRDMDPYDLPEEFSHLQAQDMSKLGFMQDLIRGIKKILVSDSPKVVEKETVVVNGSNNSSNVAPLLKRAFMFLEDGNWQDANEYCEKVLDQDPECAEAYLGKLMAELGVSKRNELAGYAKPFDDKENYQKVKRFGDEKLVTEIEGYNTNVINRIIRERNEEIYAIAKNLMENANTESKYIEAANKFNEIIDYHDANALKEECVKKAKECAYDSAKALMAENSVSSYKKAIEIFHSILEWNDSSEQVKLCEKQMAEKQIEDEKSAKKRNKITAIVLSIACILIITLLVFTKRILPSRQYNEAMELYNAGKYSEAAAEFGKLNYKDSAEKCDECKALLQISNLKNVTVGSIVNFGYYEQDNNESNGKEEIEWKVLAIKDNKALITSKYALDCKPYNASKTIVTWETCSLRKWLNNDFLNSAFDSTLQKKIVSSKVIADKNPEYDTNPGNETTDKVFLLSITEVEKYLPSDSDRKCKPTDYTVAKGAYKDYNGDCEWWLRSPGYNQTDAAYAGTLVPFIYLGDYVNSDHNGVRPALWITLES